MLFSLVQYQGTMNNTQWTWERKIEVPIEATQLCTALENVQVLRALSSALQFTRQIANCILILSAKSWWWNCTFINLQWIVHFLGCRALFASGWQWFRRFFRQLVNSICSSLGLVAQSRFQLIDWHYRDIDPSGVERCLLIHDNASLDSLEIENWPVKAIFFVCNARL